MSFLPFSRFFPASMASAYRQEGDVVLIELKLHDTRQLFNSLDPSPFIEQDLDHDAESYIIDAVGEVRAHRAKKLVVYLPAAVADSQDARTLPVAVQSYFAYRAKHALLQLRRTLREGLVSFVIGLAFLASCLMLREWLTPFVESGIRSILAEGLLIMGWVAMWRPIQIFLYDWWPIQRHGMLLAEISHMPVEVRPPAV